MITKNQNWPQYGPLHTNDLQLMPVSWSLSVLYTGPWQSGSRLLAGRGLPLHSPAYFDYVILSSLYFSLCGHNLTISFRLFRFLLFFDSFIMKSFSDKHTSQDRWPGVYGLAIFKKDHFMLGLGLSCLSHTYWERVVLLFLASERKLCVCPLKRVLNSPPVLPMYETVSFAVATSALYTTHWVQHLPGTGHASLLRQLHVREFVWLHFEMSFLLCACMMLPMLVVQL